jgi:hypothetical protein
LLQIEKGCCLHVNSFPESDTNGNLCVFVENYKSDNQQLKVAVCRTHRRNDCYEQSADSGRQPSRLKMNDCLPACLKYAH